MKSPIPLRHAFLAAALLTLLATLRAAPSVSPDLPLPVEVTELAPFPAGKRPVATSSLASASGAGAEAELRAQVPRNCRHLGVLFPDQMKLVVYRGGSGAEDLDPWIRVCDQSGRWLAPTKLGRERWKPVPVVQVPVDGGQGGSAAAVCPVSGFPVPYFSVSLAAPRATVAWYTAADEEPRILVSQTPDAGLRWTAAMRADLGAPEGRMSVATLSNGTILLAWFERAQGNDPSLPGGLYLRRYAPNGASSPPALLALVDPAKVAGRPHLTIEGEEPGGATGVLQVGFGEGAEARVLRVKLPSAAVLEELDHSCRCGPAQEPGQPLRARIKSLDTQAGTAVLRHGEIPGLLRPGELTVVLPKTQVAGLHVGDEVLGRIQDLGGRWHLLAPRRLEVVR